MYVIDGIAYAGEQTPEIKVMGIRPLNDHKLWLRFSTGEARICDLKPMLDYPAFAPLKDEAVFRDVYIDYGIPIWCDGEVDIAPEALYNASVAAEEKYSA